VFLLPLPALRPIPYRDGDAYDLIERLRWTEPDGTVGEVAPPFATDLASVPRPFRVVVPASGRHTPAAMRHDRRCDDLNTWHALGRPDELRPHLTSVEADEEFLAGVRELDPNRPLRALVLWAGVRAGAWANPARRDGWREDVLRVLLVLLLVGWLYLPLAVVNGLAILVDNLANRLALRLRAEPIPDDAGLLVLVDGVPEQAAA
jgi:hypothetical protein